MNMKMIHVNYEVFVHPYILEKTGDGDMLGFLIMSFKPYLEWWLMDSLMCSMQYRKDKDSNSM